jgi:peptide chain release factor subunit 1
MPFIDLLPQVDSTAKLKVVLAQLKATEGRATELVTFLLPAGADIVAARRFIGNELVEAGNIKSRATRDGVEASLKHTLNMLYTLRDTEALTKGLAIFASPEGATALIPPAPIAARTYRCGKSFETAPLSTMLRSSDVYALIVLDRGEFTLGMLEGTSVRLLWDEQSHIIGKHRAGGQSAHRYERQIELATVDFFKQCAALVWESLGPAEKLAQYKGLILGGPGYAKREFLDGNYLDYRLRPLVLPQLYDVGYTSDAGLSELVARAALQMKDLALAKEKRVVERFFKAVADGIGIYGTDEVWDALSKGQVETLLLDAGSDPDLSDVSVGSVVFVSDESEEGKCFKAMGGLGAILRFKA